MTHPPPSPDGRSNPRRGFLAQLAAGIAAIATTGVVARPLAGAGRRPDARAALDTASSLPRGPWDMSWVDRITAQRRQIFDSPNVSDGAALGKAQLYLAGYHEVYGTSDADLNAVIVFRHRAIPMVLADSVWTRYDFVGQSTKLKDPTTGDKAKRNPFLNPKPDDKYSLVWADGGLDSLIRRGVIVLACNMALQGFADQIADHTKQKPDAVQDELKR
ncbi:MAG TPA: hypothetical protein VIC55_06475, partial [Gemmatimonadaceae bacterium]